MSPHIPNGDQYFANPDDMTPEEVELMDGISSERLHAIKGTFDGEPCILVCAMRTLSEKLPSGGEARKISVLGILCTPPLRDRITVAGEKMVRGVEADEALRNLGLKDVSTFDETRPHTSDEHYAHLKNIIERFGIPAAQFAVESIEHRDIAESVAEVLRNSIPPDTPLSTLNDAVMILRAEIIAKNPLIAFGLDDTRESK